MLNAVIMMGRLTEDPEARQTQSGKGLAAFTIAVERSFVKQGEERQTDFFDVIAWGKSGEFAVKYFSRGQLVAVQGRMQTHSYEDRNGTKRKAYTIVAESLHFAEPKRNTGQGDAPENFTDIPDDTDDDLPF